MSLGVVSRIREVRISYEIRISFYSIKSCDLWENNWENAVIVRNTLKSKTTSTVI